MQFCKHLNLFYHSVQSWVMLFTAQVKYHHKTTVCGTIPSYLATVSKSIHYLTKWMPVCYLANYAGTWSTSFCALDILRCRAALSDSRPRIRSLRRLISRRRSSLSLDVDEICCCCCCCCCLSCCCWRCFCFNETWSPVPETVPSIILKIKHKVLLVIAVIPISRLTLGKSKIKHLRYELEII